MSETEYSEKKKSKVKSSRRKRAEKESSDDSFNASSSSLNVTQAPIVQHDNDTEAAEAAAAAKAAKAAAIREARQKEAEARRDAEAEQTRIEKGLDAEEEAAALAAYSVPAAAERALYERPYSGASALASFQGLERWARELNLPVTSCPEPEIVFVGHAGSGKTTLLSSLLGVPLPAEATRRPVLYHINGVDNNNNNNSKSGEESSNDKMFAVLRRDTFITEYANQQQQKASDVTALNEALTSRNQSTEEPVDVELTLPGHIRMTLVDTPGFVVDPDAPAAATAEAVLRTTIAPSNRLIVVVRRAIDQGQYGDYLMDLVRQADPTLSRTVVVNTHFSAYLQSAAAQAPKAVARFLSGSSTAASIGVTGASVATTTTSANVPDGRVFFVTLPDMEVMTSSSKNPTELAETFAQKVWQCALRDASHVESLQCDTQAVGARNFARCIFAYVWRVHQASAPRVLHALRARRADCAAKAQACAAQRERIGPSLFRVLAAGYAVDFLGLVRSLVAGSAAGLPSLNGQTTPEERAACGTGGEWADSEGRAIEVRYDEWAVPHWQSRVYGGQQFERLLAEFAAVCSHVTIDVINDDDVIVAAGVPRLGGLPPYTAAACTLACRRAEAALAPLVAQLGARATYVMKRLARIAVTSLAAKNGSGNYSGNSKNSADVCLLEGGAAQCSKFTHFVCDKYASLIDSAGALCAQLCAEEFHSAQAVHFSAVECAAVDPPATPEEVRALAAEVFEAIKARIAKNVALKFYNAYIVPVGTALWADLQKAVSELDDKALENLFEAERAKADLQKTEEAVKKELESLVESEKDVVKLSNAFCHPK